MAACGGDGTAGWVLSVMDTMEFPNGPPSIGMIPLGTGNDLSKSLNWGGKYKDEPLENIITDIENADVVKMDRWTLEVTPIISDLVEEDMDNCCSHLTTTDNAEKNLVIYNSDHSSEIRGLCLMKLSSKILLYIFEIIFLFFISSYFGFMLTTRPGHPLSQIQSCSK